ncbi:ABC transporter permease [Aeromicrobium panaciterrae]|uniref:ABC transporter permease n=1 Tax=Aeromicrobium panaciterrae TaxID=363861 RepID=UPI0031DF47B8
MAILGLLVICTAIPGIVAPGDPTTVSLPDALSSPDSHHLLGTDQFGRDILRRVVQGARVSLLIAIAATLLAGVIGTTIGLVAGFVGRFVDSSAMWLVDVMLSFPAFTLALTIVAALGSGTSKVVLAVGIALIPVYARVARAEVLSIRERPYVEAARASGSSNASILWRHVLPNAAGPVVVLATVSLGTVLLAASSLSFLGLGAAPPSPEWGAMLADGRRFIGRAWWIPLFPGMALLLTVLSVNIVGQWLRERTDNR